MSQMADYIINRQQFIDDLDYEAPNPEADHQELCPKCNEPADVFIVGNAPDDYYSELRCDNCLTVIQD